MKWVLAESDDAAAAALEQTGLHPLIARLMAIRGITEPSIARSFLSCDLSSLSDPGVFLNMEKAAARIRAAIASREKIVVYGDYDVDGVTGTSLLYSALKQSGADADCYLPDRLTEGYGLNARALESIKASGAGLVISVDCGITAVKEAEHARTLGLDLIITDHHEINRLNGSNGSNNDSNDSNDLNNSNDSNRDSNGSNSSNGLNRSNGSNNSSNDSNDLNNSNDPNGLRLPNAYAVLHPALLVPEATPDTRQQVSGLTGVGVAFKLAQALMNAGAGDERLAACLDLVALGTVADVGRITGENRVLVKHGLDLLSSGSETQRPGIAALKQVSGLSGKKIGVGVVGFTLAPRLNASGRLARADSAFRLLTTASREEALELASALDAVNRERQSVEECIWRDARLQCRRMDTSAAGALVLSSDAWHPGVIGIVASRLVEEFFRPTALIHIRNGVGKGSARSIPGFDLYEGLVACSDLLLGFGGHKYAAGFTITKENIPLFRERLGSLVRERVGPQGFVKTLCVDGAVTFDDLTVELMRAIEKLAPFGQGNPEPRLGARDLAVVSSKIVGNNHLKLRLRQQGGASLAAIAFGRGGLLGKQVKDGARLAAVFTPRLNAWNGKTTVELEIRDIKTDK